MNDGSKPLTDWIGSREVREEILSEHGFKGIIGSSAPFMYVLHKVRQVAASDTAVLIRGETGVGKEIIAGAIHNMSARRQGPFIKVNCAALPGELLESEMFGHKRGAFTGAIRDKAGLLEVADGGSFFLDELAEMPMPLQAKMLRFLQERVIERLGGRDTIEVDVRIV